MHDITKKSKQVSAMIQMFFIKPTVFVMTKHKGWEIKPSGRGMKMCFLGQTPCFWSHTRDESERANEKKCEIKPSGGGKRLCFLDKHPVSVANQEPRWQNYIWRTSEEIIQTKRATCRILSIFVPIL